MSGIKTFDELPRPRRGSAPPAVRGPRKTPLIGVIRNTRSHRNTGREQGSAPGAEVILESTQKRRELTDVLDRFAQKGVDYLAISGGDGTVRDVLTGGAEIFGDDWPPLIVLPKGKTNALATDLGAPSDWRLAEAFEVARAGRFAMRRPLVVANADDPAARVQGFMLGAGVFRRAISLGQDAHSWGAFNALAVGVTSAWALGQAMLAGKRNPWRQRSLMRLADAQGRPLPGGDQRYIMLASTLERFALGLKPFGPLREGLKITVLDTPDRRSLLWVPAIALGRLPDPPELRGYHRLSPDAFEMEVGEPFVLDGEAFPPGRYRVSMGPLLRFAAP
ncbi:MAG: diacylglycerol/lipid kinase family protein [Croceibacterium sp.]